MMIRRFFALVSCYIAMFIPVVALVFAMKMSPVFWLKTVAGLLGLVLILVLVNRNNPVLKAAETLGETLSPEDQKALQALGKEGARIAFIMAVVVSLGIGRLGGADVYLSLVCAFCLLLGLSLGQVWCHVKEGVQERTRCTESAS